MRQLEGRRLCSTGNFAAGERAQVGYGGAYAAALLTTFGLLRQSSTTWRKIF